MLEIDDLAKRYGPVVALVPLRAAFDAISPVEVMVAVIVTVAAIWVLFGSGRASTPARCCRPRGG